MSEKFSDLYYEKAIELLKKICIIPSPSGEEDQRVAFILDYLKENGIDDAFSDDAKNVIIPFGFNETNSIDVFAAHTDVVFPDRDELKMVEDGPIIHCPGIGDDTASVVCLIMCALELKRINIKSKRGILIVLNSSEEGLGNLKGTRKLFDSYKDRIKSFTTFDAALGNGIVNKAVGSERYLIKVKTEGGHSYKNFGAKNAINEIAKIITSLYDQDVSSFKETTYNVGTIKGGTSVNTIAESAECTYEFRSTSKDFLDLMRTSFEKIIESFKKDGLDVSFSLIGNRPCGIETDLGKLESIAEEVLRGHGLSTRRSSSSTDCNIPLSLGIPALCIGVVEFKGAHTYEEYMNTSSYGTGLDVGYEYLKKVVES